MKKINRFMFIFSSLFITFFSAGNAEDYQFNGIHYLASYHGCNPEALCSLDKLKETMIQAVKESGATLLDATDFIFPPDGYTMVMLLSESHASIHTYPEFQACFIDLFTCGTSCSYENFEEVITNYLQPKQIDHSVIKRF